MKQQISQTMYFSWISSIYAISVFHHSVKTTDLSEDTDKVDPIKLHLLVSNTLHQGQEIKLTTFRDDWHRLPVYDFKHQKLLA